MTPKSYFIVYIILSSFIFMETALDAFIVSYNRELYIQRACQNRIKQNEQFQSFFCIFSTVCLAVKAYQSI